MFTILDKEAALKLAERVNAAVELLTDYNNRLAHEMEERKRVMQMLRDYAILQKQLLQQAESRIEVMCRAHIYYNIVFNSISFYLRFVLTKNGNVYTIIS